VQNFSAPQWKKKEMDAIREGQNKAFKALG